MKEIMEVIRNARITDGRHKFSPELGYPLITDGLMALDKEAKCIELYVRIGSWQTKSSKPDPEFQKWVLTVKDNKSGKLLCYNKNGKRVLTDKISYIDTPLIGLTLYLIDGVLMLPGEYMEV